MVSSRRLAAVTAGAITLSVAGCAGQGESNPAYTKGRVTGRCLDASIAVGDRYRLLARIHNDSNVDWPHTYVFIGGADHFVREFVTDDAGDIAAPNDLDDFQLRGIRPHRSMTVMGEFVAKDAGNYTIDVEAWGGGNVDKGEPDHPLNGGCDITVNP